jgi:hypothetical protein
MKKKLYLSPMKNILFGCIFFMHQVYCTAQTMISLDYKHEDMLHAPFFIKDVVDERPDKTKIGLMHADDSISPVKIKMGLRNSLISYCNNVIGEEPNQKPVVMKVNEVVLDIHANIVSTKTIITFIEPLDSGYLILFTSIHQLDTVILPMKTQQGF